MLHNLKKIDLQSKLKNINNRNYDLIFYRKLLGGMDLWLFQR